MEYNLGGLKIMLHGKNKKSLTRTICIFVFLFCTPLAAYAGNPMVGAGLYSAHCVKCHGGNGRATMAGTPDLIVHQLISKSNHQLISTIKNGKGIMPAYQGLLTEQQLDDILAYLKTFF